MEGLVIEHHLAIRNARTDGLLSSGLGLVRRIQIQQDAATVAHMLQNAIAELELMNSGMVSSAEFQSFQFFDRDRVVAVVELEEADLAVDLRYDD